MLSNDNKRSNLHLVVNTNISHRYLSSISREERADIIKVLTNTLEDLKTAGFSEFKKNTIKSELIDYTAYLEVGTKKKFLHVDSIARFEGFTQLDSKRIQFLFNDRLKQYSKGTYVNIKFIPDNLQTVEDYSKKDGMQLI